MRDYRNLADALAAEIAAGRLRPGDRLLPQREFAHQRGIAASTASRVYGELIRRGLVTGEVGRGSYVCAAKPAPHPALAEPGTARVDLELIVPLVPEQARLLAEGLEPFLRRSAALQSALRPATATGAAMEREIAASFLARGGWSPHPSGILFTGNGKQAIAATLAALVPPGERLGVEALTYPVVKGLAARLGIDLVPLAVDHEGLRPDALAAAHQKTPMRAIYCQPVMHNPLGATLPEQRRAEIAALARQHDLWVIEDAVYAFLAGERPPLAALAPERTILLDSLSKRLAPGLTLGFILAPEGLATRIASAVRSGAWTASGFALAAGTRWMGDGTAAAISAAKREDAASRQSIARDRLAGLALQSDPGAYHCWLVLPEPWRAEAFVATAAREGIAIAPASAFAIAAGHAPNAVRIALASPSPEVLGHALDFLARMARTGPPAWGLE